jgi:hypothetical protein
MGPDQRRPDQALWSIPEPVSSPLALSLGYGLGEAAALPVHDIDASIAGRSDKRLTNSEAA